MEALGRGIACLFCAWSLVVLCVYQKTSSMGWQRNQTVRSLSKEYVKEVQRRGEITKEGWLMFVQELHCLGEFDVTLTVYEKKRFENESGAMYLYSEWEPKEEKALIPEGSIVRLTVFQKDTGAWNRFWYGADCVVYIGGRIA